MSEISIFKHNSPLGEIKKAREIIKAESQGGDIDLLDRQIFNILLNHAYPNILSGQIHKISMLEIKKQLNRNDDRLTRIMTSLEKLWNVQISIDYIDEQNKPHKMLCRYLSFDACTVEDGWLEYSFDPILQRYLHEPKVYALIQIASSSRFKTKGGLKLYETMMLYFRRHSNTWECNIEEAMNFFEVEGVYRDRIERFRKCVVEPAVAEVNEISEIHIDVEFMKFGRGNKIIGIKFTPEQKNSDQLALAVEKAGSPIIKSSRKKERDDQTIDLLTGVSDAEIVVNEYALKEAERLIGKPAHEEADYFLKNVYRKNKAGDVSELFLSWVEMKNNDKNKDILSGINVDDLISSLMMDE